MYDYDTIFIGSGHACWHGALILKFAGKKVALVEKDVLGGTCTNFGCDAKILLDMPFLYKEGFDRYQGKGLAQEAKISWKDLMAYKKQVIGSMPAALDGLFGQFGFDVIRGAASFVDAHTIAVEGKNYTAKNIVIGVGQEPVVLPLPGVEYTHNSRDFLSLDEMPERLILIGTGIIAMEFASLALTLGKQVTVIGDRPRALEQYPEAYAKRVVDEMEKRGAKFIFNAKVTAFEKEGKRVIVEGHDPIDGDYICVAAGRRPNFAGLNLEKIGIRTDRAGIVVDSHLRTSVKNVYASGDCVSARLPRLTPVAEFQSNYIALDILLPIHKPISYPVIPNLVFTLPRIAAVGVDIDAAKKDSKYRVEEVSMGQTMAWLNGNQLDEHATYVFEGKRLVGASFYSEFAGSYVDLAAMIINQKITGKKLAKMIFSFPTATYAMVSGLIPLMLKK